MFIILTQCTIPGGALTEATSTVVSVVPDDVVDEAPSWPAKIGDYSLLIYHATIGTESSYTFSSLEPIFQFLR